MESQCVAVCCSVLQCEWKVRCVPQNLRYPPANHCKTLHYNALHCTTLHYIASHCHTLQAHSLGGRTKLKNKIWKNKNTCGLTVRVEQHEFDRVIAGGQIGHGNAYWQCFHWDWKWVAAPEIKHSCRKQKNSKDLDRSCSRRIQCF